MCAAAGADPGRVCARHLEGLPAPHQPGCRPTLGEVTLFNRQRSRPPAAGGGPVLHLLTIGSLRAHADRPSGSSALRRSPAPAHTVSEASPLRKFHRPGRAAGTPLEAAARSMARGASGCVAARGVPARPGLPRYGLPSRRLPCPAPRARHPWAQRRAGEQRGCRAGGHRACLGTCLAGVARRRARRLRAHPAHRGRVPACPCHRHDGQVAPACGLIVGMFAVPCLLPEHRPASGDDSSEGNGASRSIGKTPT